ncbi:hypothetical protein, partial [Bradyrhizobium japonicum]|uniref:hypothetical protein n=1 Tax=Bradyrhizobium japonicum TaxID=375 RepID=UPI0012FD5714
MTDVRNLLIRGSEKVTVRYRLLIAGAKNEKERELYLSRIEREQWLLDQLQGGLPETVRGLRSRRGSLCGLRCRVEASRTRPVEVGRLRGWKRGRHGRRGVQQGGCQIQGGARA